ncbi:mitochondrial fission ELM1 family protein [Marivibrio halodurans]|uniref:Mitochondrial fission ELM1 family protein n=1 Tax=Marivibrio halodurans TaxID=2039722 RepID=A0A8J7RXI6_9PROT|nr:mitochondrial fission ELM1 family protein [Marivibrio halodurans]MBP5856370.1 mitochondrial fission ELM1 family protein [Marivibrio halodurans]
MQPVDEFCWVLTDGKAGMEAQALGLAEAVGLPVTMKRLRGGFPWRFLPAACWPPGVMGLSPRSDQLVPPWPRLVISCGRHAVGPALAVRRRSRGATVVVHVQHPHVPLSRFDLVVAPRHDRVNGPNVEVTTGSVHRITRARLDEAAAAMAEDFKYLPRPLIAVLIGGTNGAYRLDEVESARLAHQLKDLSAKTRGSLLVTPSRRTGEENIRILRRALHAVPSKVWDMQGENPYFGWLGAADAVLVTGDSVNMVSEATATGKPVYRLDLPTVGRVEKFKRFHAAMEELDAVRPFEGRIDLDWTPGTVDDTPRAAARVKALLAERRADA